MSRPDSTNPVEDPQAELKSLLESGETQHLEQAQPAGSPFQDTGNPSAWSSTQKFSSRAPAAETWVGKTLGRYQITGHLGTGGMGVVYQAHDAAIGRDVAIKILPRASDDEHRLERFQSEARAAGQLMHPHIVPIYEVGEHDGTHYIVMEAMTGGTTEDQLKRSGPLPPEQATRIILEACDGLAAAHGAGLVHRDIKPENLLLSASGSIKVADFGLAKGSFRNSLQLTQDGHLVGTPYYMSPEQCQGRPVDPRSDIYSLGATYYKLLTGKNPYEERQTTVDILHAHCHAPVLDPARHNPHIPQICAAIVARATAKAPEDRYQTAAELRDDLEAGLKQLLEQPAARPGKSKVSAPRLGRVGRIAVTMLGLLVLAGLGSWAWSTWGPTSSVSQENAGKQLPEIPQTPLELARGVTDTEIIFGTTTAYSGANRELGRNMVLGIRTCFAEVNAQGGIHGRKLNLVVLDDGYEPDTALQNMRELIETRRVFGVIGNVGTPTARATVPYALNEQVLFFAPFTGAEFLRRDPPDRYVFNYRASYADETSALVNYFVDLKRISPQRIAVLAQNDSYGDDGFEGVARALFRHGIRPEQIIRVSHERNSVRVEEAVAGIEQRKDQIDAVIMVSTYKASARFVSQLKNRGVDRLQFAAISFVGSDALAEEFREVEPKHARGVIVTEVVPSYRSSSTGVLRYRNLLKKHYPEAQPGFISLEGFIAAECLVAGLKKVPPGKLNTETLIDALESIRDLDLGIGPIIQFGPSRHQASRRVWAGLLDENGGYEPFDLEKP